MKEWFKSIQPKLNFLYDLQNSLDITSLIADVIFIVSIATRI